MSNFTLNVTASEPFADNAPITRAMLRNASVPIVTATGSVGSEFIQSGAITNAKVSATASEAIAHTKIAVPEGSLVIGGTNNIGSELEPTSNLAGNGVDGNVKLLADTGTKYEALVTSLSSTGGHVGVQKYTADNGVNTLKLVLNTGVITAAHVSTTGFYDGNSITKNSSSGKLEIADGGVHHQKLYPYKNAAGTQMPGFLVYGASGAATVLEAKTDPCVPVTVSASGTPVTKVYRKYVNLGKFDHSISGSSQNGSGRIRGLHGIGTGSTVPNHVSIVLACTNTNTSTHGYTSGDRLYVGGRGDHYNGGMTPFADGQYVGVFIHTSSHIEIPKKYGGDSPDSSTHSGHGETAVEWSDVEQDFDVVAVVSE